MSCLRSLLTMFALLFVVAPAHAGTVAIVQPPGSTPGLTETVSRIHGELLSVGLDVEMIAPPADRDTQRENPRPWIERIAAQGGIDAVIDIVGDKAPVWVDVWVIEKSPPRLEFSRVTAEPNASNASERLAIRAIEVLRSSFLENDMSGRRPQAKPVPETAVTTRPQMTPAETPRHSEVIGVGLGATLLAGVGGVGPAILPVVQVDANVRPWFAIRGELAGLGTRSSISSAAGNARIAQQYAILGGSYRVLTDHPLNAFIALSAGALHTSVAGEADAPRQGHTANLWSFIADGSIGASLRLTRRFYLNLAAHVQLAEPYVAVHVVDSIVATSGRPNFGLTLTMGVWL